MNNIRESLSELQSINQNYGMDCARIKNYLQDMDIELLCIPIIGAFSSGKSAALNTLLGFSGKILVEDITPETAIPTELQYRFDPMSENTVRVTHTDGHDETVTIQQYMADVRDNLNASDVSAIRLNLEHAFFQTIPRIMVVDMPGFGSGDDIHDKAINNYAKNSMAYIIAFPADDLTMREGVGDILKELCGLNKPICVMITKMDKAPPAEGFDATLNMLKRGLTKYIGDREIEWLETSAKDGNIDDLKDYLQKMNDKSERLLYEQKHLPFLRVEAGKTLAYLRERKEKAALSESELKEQEERLKADMKNLMEKTAGLTQTFRMETELCVEEISGDILRALHGDLDRFVSMAMNKNGQKDISESVNSTVRIAANTAVQQRFIVKAQKYVQNVTAEIAVSESFVALTESYQSEGVGAVLSKGAQNMVKGVIAQTLITGIFGPLMLALFPIPILGLVAGIVGIIGGIISGKRKREEARGQIRQQFLSQVFPSVLNQVRPAIQKELVMKTNEICGAMEKQLTEYQASLEKALTDIRGRQADEEDEKNRISVEIQNDIMKAEALYNAV